MQCISYLEDELKEHSENYFGDNYEDLPDYIKKRDNVEWNFSEAIHKIIENGQEELIMVAVDMDNGSVCQVPKDFEPRNCILLYSPNDFIIRRLGWKPYANYDKIRKLAKELFKK